MAATALARVAGLTGGAIASLAVLAPAQQEAWRLFGESSVPEIGTSVALLGDVDGDGVADYVAGGPASTWEPGGIGHALICSGIDGSIVFDLEGARFAEFGRCVARAGDLDGDGIVDFALGAPREGNGAVHFHSGATGARIRTWTGATAGGAYGYAVANVGDLDGDGVDEFAVGAPDDASGGTKLGRVTLQSGASGNVLASFTGASIDGKFGSVVADGGDVDGDGAHDLLILEQADQTSGTSSGTLTIVSGATSSVVRKWTLGAWGSHWAAAGAGDVNGDGLDDVVVGNDQWPQTLVWPFSYYGAVWVYDGATGALLHNLTRLDRMGAAVDGAGDVDGDGFEDFAFGCLNFGVNSVRVHSGISGALLVDAPTDSRVAALDAGVDLTGEGVPDLVIGLPLDSKAGFAGAVGVVDATAQLVVRRAEGTGRADYLGYTSALLDDVDGDGTRDLLVGAGGLSGAYFGVGRASVLSGVDGSELRVHDGVSRFDCYASRVAALPDVDGDSIGDYAIAVTGSGPTYAGFVEVRSGATGLLLRTLAPAGGGVGWFDAEIAVAIQPSGAVELAVGAPWYGSSGEFQVFDVATGAVVVTVVYPAGYDADFGDSVAWMGDLDGDGVGDWAVGVPLNRPNPIVMLVSNTTGNTLLTLNGAKNSGYGSAVAGAGDVDGDGIPEVLIGAPNVKASSGNYGGAVYLCSGATGNVLRTRIGQANRRLGSCLTPVGDVNRDGFLDALYGAWGRALLVSGATGGILYRFEGDGAYPQGLYGTEPAGIAAPGSVGSMNGDSIPDIAISAPQEETNGFQAGRFSLYLLDDLYLQLEPPIATTGDTVTATTSGAPHGNLAALYLVATDGAAQFDLLALGTLDFEGRWIVSDTIPPGLAGHVYTLQSFAIGASGKLVVTQPMPLTLQ